MPIQAIKIVLFLLILIAAVSPRNKLPLTSEQVHQRAQRIRQHHAKYHSNNDFKLKATDYHYDPGIEKTPTDIGDRHSAPYIQAVRDKYRQEMFRNGKIAPLRNGQNHRIRDIEDSSPCEGETNKCYHEHNGGTDSDSEPFTEETWTETPETETETGIIEPATQKSDLTMELQNALPLLEKISAEISQTKQEASHHLRNDFQCEIDGLWTSNVGGVRLRLTTHEDGRIAVVVNATDAPHLGNLQDCSWHLSGLVPSKRQGPFAMAAVCSRQHRIAVFLGQCKVCEDAETIFGNWMFSRLARDCSDAMMALETKSDVWRRDHSEDAKHKHHPHIQGVEGEVDNTTCVTPLLPSDD